MKALTATTPAISTTAPHRNVTSTRLRAIQAPRSLDQVVKSSSLSDENQEHFSILNQIVDRRLNRIGETETRRLHQTKPQTLIPRPALFYAGA